MNARERLNAVLHHQAADQLCVDMGAGGQTGIGVCALYQLRKAVLGEDSLIKVHEPYQMLGEVDDKLREALGLDVVGVPTPSTMFGNKLDDWKEFTMPDGTPCLVPGSFNTTVNESGDVLTYPEGDTSVPASARMPASSYFFDATRRQHPIDESNLNPADNTEEFGLLSDRDIEWYVREVTRVYNETHYGIYITMGGTAFGDIALVPGTWLKDPKGIRAVDEWYMATAANPEYVHAVFEKQCEYALKNIEKLAEALGDMVQAVFVSGTDFGTQRSLFCSLDCYRDLYKPYHIAVNKKIHELTKWKTFIHSCGAVYPLIPDLIEAGFDILNPVQCSAEGMEPRRLKKEFGNDIVFWGGGIDTQKTLPFGTPDEVYREARERIDIFFEDQTGFVFNSVHNIQSNVPVENILAMFKAVDDARRG